MFDGKRTYPIELPRSLRMDAEMGAAVRELATRNRRSIGQQLLVLIELGINVELVGLRRKPPQSVTLTEEKRKAAR